MATIEFSGLDDYMEELETIYTDIPRITSMALYDAAGELADAIDAEISGLSELNAIQRKGLHEGLGIARFWNSVEGTYTKIGFDGYNELATDRWPRGQPNAMIARALIRGTSWMKANRFTARAARKSRKQCVETMQKRVDREIQALIK